MVAVDVLPAEIVGWADVVLPEATYLERCDELYAPWWREPFVAVRQEVVPPMYDSKPGWWIARELGKPHRPAGLLPLEGHGGVRQDASRSRRARLRRHAGRRRDPRASPARCTSRRARSPSSTPTRARSSSTRQTLAALGFDPMPTYDARPRGAARGLLRLLFGRAPVHTFGRTTNNRLLSRGLSARTRCG